MSETFERNAKGVREMLSMKFDTLDFEGVWHASGCLVCVGELR